jgi:hypothetical protein
MDAIKIQYRGGATGMRELAEIAIAKALCKKNKVRFKYEPTFQFGPTIPGQAPSGAVIPKRDVTLSGETDCGTASVVLRMIQEEGSAVEYPYNATVTMNGFLKGDYRVVP